MSAAASMTYTAPRDSVGTRFRRRGSTRAAAAVIAVVSGSCAFSLPWTMSSHDNSRLQAARLPPGGEGGWMGTDRLGRSLAARALLGGAISLGVGAAAASVSVVIGVTWGLVAGWFGGALGRVMMRVVDVLYGLPYILIVILLKVALDDLLIRRWSWPVAAANLTVLLLSIGAVSWLTMARVIRAQVLSLRAQPFVEAAIVMGVPTWRIGVSHLLPNLSGPILAYAALIVPQAILQESMLSFLGIGIERPLPSWGNLAADGVSAINTVESFWWLLLFPCGLLTTALLCLHALGEGLREALDPRSAGRR